MNEVVINKGGVFNGKIFNGKMDSRYSRGECKKNK